MRIAITGATGMIGSKLTDFLLAQGHEIALITRRSYHRPQTSVIIWDPELNYIKIEALEGFDVIIHLAGANIAKRWSKEYKKEILESRVQSTRLLCESLGRLRSKPKLLICASAIGYYGNHPSQEFLDENSPAGTGFLADVCHRWEDEAAIATQAGIRVVQMRLGIVLDKTGGALGKMWLAFQLGFGGILGSGRQMMSWIALDEIPLVVDHLMKNIQLSGAVNVVAPQAVSNKQFTESLAQAMGRPTLVAYPAFMVRLLLGEMGQSLLLEGAHVLPRRLQESGYEFHFPDLKTAFKKVID